MYRPDAHPDEQPLIYLDPHPDHDHRLAEAEGEQATYLVCTLCPYFEVKDD